MRVLFPQGNIPKMGKGLPSSHVLCGYRLTNEFRSAVGIGYFSEIPSDVIVGPRPLFLYFVIKIDCFSSL